MISTCPYEKFC